MENEAVVCIVKNAPIDLKVYLRAFVMNDDTVTPAHLSKYNPKERQNKGS